MEKPVVKLVGKNGNVFNLIGLTKKALLKAGEKERAKEFVKRAFESSSYSEVISLIEEYCEIE